MARRKRNVRVAEDSRGDKQHDKNRDLIRGIEELHARLADLEAYLDAAHRVLPEIGRIESPDGRRLFGFLFLYVENAHALAQRSVDDVKRLAELAIRVPSPRAWRDDM